MIDVVDPSNDKKLEITSHQEHNIEEKTNNYNEEKTIVKTSKLTKMEKTMNEREILLAKLASNNLKDIRSKVAFVLNHYPETRNSDIKLAFRYWTMFQPEHLLADGMINQAKLFKLERIPSLVRARAKIQNEFGLFGPDKEVKDKRRSLEFKQKEEQLSSKPGTPSITFYIDESSKNQEYIIVGGLSSVDAYQSFKLANHLLKWVNDKKINYEFHFTELTKHKLEVFKDFFNEALSFSNVIGFKAVAVTRSGIKQRTIDEIIIELHYQLIHKAMEHEIETKRVSLPRQVSAYKDKEDGTDGILMTKLEQGLKAGFSTHFGNHLSLERLQAVDSKSNYFIQLADLYIGSVARILNRNLDSPNNHKDEFAEFVISTLGLNLNNNQDSSNRDMAFVYILNKDKVL